jgi:hypothetical protein
MPPVVCPPPPLPAEVVPPLPLLVAPVTPAVPSSTLPPHAASTVAVTPATTARPSALPLSPIGSSSLAGSARAGGPRMDGNTARADLDQRHGDRREDGGQLPRDPANLRRKGPHVPGTHGTAVYSPTPSPPLYHPVSPPCRVKVHAEGAAFDRPPMAGLVTTTSVAVAEPCAVGSTAMP